MAKTYKTGIIITGDGKGGVKAIGATEKALKGLNRTTRRTGRQFKRTSRQVSAFTRGPARYLNTWWALAAVGIRQAGSELLSFGDQIDKLSTRIGASTEALSEYQHVAELSGVRFSALSIAWQRQSRRLSEAARGTGEAKKALQELGLSAAHLNQLAPEEQFEVLADALNGVENEADRVRLAFKFWDSEGVAMLQATKNGSAGLREMREEARMLGKSLTQEQAQDIAQFNNSLTRPKNNISGELNRALLAHLGDLTEVSDALQQQVTPAFDRTRQVMDLPHFAFEGFEIPPELETLSTELDELFPEDLWDTLLLLPDHVTAATDSALVNFSSMIEEINVDIERFARLMERPWLTFADFVSEQWEEMAVSIARVLDQILRHTRMTLFAAAKSLDEVESEWANELAAKLRKIGAAASLAATMEVDLRVEFEAENQAREEAISALENEIIMLESLDLKLDLSREKSLRAIQDRLDERKNELDTMRFIAQAEREFEFEREQRSGQSADNGGPPAPGAPIDPDAVSDWTDSAITALDNYKTDAMDISNEVETAFANNMKGMKDALVEFVKTGKLDFSSLADSIISDLIRIQVRQSITGPLSGMLNTFVNGLTDGGGEVWSKENLMMVPANHSGGIVGSEGAGRYVHPAVFADAPRLHTGGLAGSEVPAILKRGEGVFTEGQMKALGMSRSQNIKVEVVNKGTPQQANNTDVRFDGKDMVVRIFTEDLSRNGPMARSIATNFTPRRSF